jgi:signal transduction histidine kinase
MSRTLRSFGLQLFIALVGAAPGVCPLGAAEAQSVLTHIGEIRAASAEIIAGKPRVHVKGVVTRSAPNELFIQDDTDAIFVWQPADHPDFKLGDLVEVVGNAVVGSFAPLIKAEHIDFLGRGVLPVPKQASFHELASGREDCHWVEVEGVVRTVEPTSWGCLILQLAVDGELLRVVVATPAVSAPQVPPGLFGSRVRLRGVAAGSKTPQRRMVEPVLWGTYTPETFTVLETGPADVFSVPLHPAESLLAYGSDTLSERLTRVQGVVTAWHPPDLLFVRDGGHGFEIHVQQPVSLQVGARVEAVGFPEMGDIQPILQNAFVRVLSSGPPPLPTPIAASDHLDFAHEADLVEIAGELRDLSRRADGIVAVVSAGNVLFNAELGGNPPSPAPLPAMGSRVVVTGIYHIDRLGPPNEGQLVRPASFRLHLRTLDDIRLIAAPPWWTARRLLIVLAILAASLVLALGWVWSLNRRVDRQTRIILDETRKSARFEERSRIAREFHDTLEQQLAGATIMLDAIAEMQAIQPQRAKESLDNVRAMLRHSLAEAQQSVLDLRDNEMVGCDLPSLIERSVRSLVDPTGVTVDFRFEGVWPDMDIVVKRHLLRIAQESVTNALKHAAPTRITVAARVLPDGIDLRVTDDGRGFDLQGGRPGGTGKFGLIGLRERADKVQGTLTIESAPNRGTTVAVSLPRKTRLRPL